MLLQRSIVMTTFLGTIGAAAAFAQEPPLWNGLPRGKYGVGFSNLWAFDATRPYAVTYSDGTRYAEEPAPRPILVNVWYPSDDVDGDRLCQGEYLDIESDAPRLARFAAELEQYERAVITKELFDRPKSALNEAESKMLDDFYATPTACVRDAEVTDQKFPIVVYHAGYGSSFDDNSVLCEFLASHGYVVVGSAYQEDGGRGFNIDAAETSARDVEFLVATVSKRADVDGKGVAMVGHSGGAHAAIRQQSRGSSILSAIVRLDTTQDYYSVVDPRWGDMPTSALGHVERMTAPMLFAANPYAIFQMADALGQADRWYFTATLDHNEFISQGIVRAELETRRAPDDAAKAAHLKEVRARYVALDEFLLDFLDSALKRDASATDHLENRFRETRLDGCQPHVEFVAKGTTKPPAYPADASAPPTPRQFRGVLAERGLDATVALLRRIHASQPWSPLLHPLFGVSLVYEWIAFGRADEGATLGRLYHEFIPEFLDAINATGELQLRFVKDGDTTTAVSFFHTVLGIDPENEAAKRGLAQADALRGRTQRAR